MATPAADLFATLTLWRVLEQSDRAYRALLSQFLHPEAVLDASPDHWRLEGVPPAKRALFQRWKQGELPEVMQEVEATLAWLDHPNRHLLTLEHEAYPRLLKEIADPPPLLFVRGDPAFLSVPQIAIVGTRNPSRTGLQLAEDFARELAGRGLAITSGLALGIDGAAHRGTLAAKGVTIAVLGTGPDRLYPKAHLELAGEIERNAGLIISEYLPGTAALATNFPRRNRIISGLSLGTLVVEAALKSGSLITARLATEQGREVWAMPGSVHNVQAKGCHALIRDGVKLVEEAAHVLEDIGPMLGLLKEDIRTPAQAPAPAATGPQAQLLEALGWECSSLDALVEASGLPAGEVLGLLMQLELEGLVASVPGGYERLPG